MKKKIFINFDGDYSKTLGEIEAFQPYWKMDSEGNKSTK